MFMQKIQTSSECVNQTFWRLFDRSDLFSDKCLKKS